MSPSLLVFAFPWGLLLIPLKNNCHYDDDDSDTIMPKYANERMWDCFSDGSRTLQKVWGFALYKIGLIAEELGMVFISEMNDY